MEWSNPRVHEHRETSGSLVVSDLTQAHRAAAGSPRTAERKGRGMQLRGWGEDSRGCPGKLGDPVRRRQGPNGRTPGPGCVQTERGSERPVRDRVPTPETAGKVAALRDKEAPSGSKSSVLTRGRRSAAALRLKGGRDGGDGGGGARRGGAGRAPRVGWGGWVRRGELPWEKGDFPEESGVWAVQSGCLGETLVYATSSSLAPCMPQVTCVCRSRVFETFYQP